MSGMRIMRRLLVTGSAVFVVAFAAVGLVPLDAFAEDLEADAVYLPAANVSSLAVRNPLGAVRVNGWDRPQLRIIAHKRARTPGVLPRLKVRVDLDGAGDLRVTTGFYLADQTFNALPLQGATIDLTIDVPRGVALTALTFTGDIEVGGFRAGAHLSSQGGQIRVADVVGPVDTRTLHGNQWLEEIRGSLLASGVVGDLALWDIEGQRVEASVFQGQILAREVKGAVVRLRSVVGSIVLTGALLPGGRYDLAVREGDVRLRLQPAPFTVVARAPSVKSGFALSAVEKGGEKGSDRSAAQRGGHGAGIQRGQFQGGGGAQLELASARGEVSLLPVE